MYLTYFIIIDTKTGNWYPACRPRENGITFNSLTQSQPPRLFTRKPDAKAAITHLYKNCPDADKMELQIVEVEVWFPFQNNETPESKGE